MKRNRFFLIILAVLLIAQAGFSQLRQKDDRLTTIYDQEQQQEKKEKALNDLMLIPQINLPAGKNGAEPLSNSERKKEEKRIKALIAPRPEDLAKYSALLSQRHTGLFRLFPDYDCEEQNVVRTDGSCENFIPGSSAYSFRNEDYQLFTPFKFYDIKFKDGNLISREFLSQGILTEIGDIPLENVSPESRGLKFLNDFNPETKSSEVKRQFAQIAGGIESEGFVYSKSLPAKENMTYAIRVTAYQVPLSLMDRDLKDKRLYALAAGYLKEKRVDVIVVFRIIRKETDGNITILWKELKRQKAPEIGFSKEELALLSNSKR